MYLKALSQLAVVLLDFHDGSSYVNGGEVKSHSRNSFFSRFRQTLNPLWTSIALRGYMFVFRSKYVVL